ncbi:MAG TPA: tryptophan synthase subunit alpha [Candidatus Eremiobacteraceae bacterium]|nr:tryptophan synthase subunit alpha [Candidatus Eremiobacteraceae bacterium]
MRVAARPLAETFGRCREDGRAALIAFLTAGFPSLAQTPALIMAAIEGGADMIEIGFPYSDPVADGPVIQASSQHALDHGATFDRVLEIAARCAASVPLIAFTYYNPLFARGLVRCAQELHAAGFAGAIVPDLPPEESAPLCDAFARTDLSLTFLVAPTTPLERARAIAARCDDFVYVAGRLGVTGTHAGVDQTVLERVADLRRLMDKPLAVGFGVSRPEEVAQIAAAADGVIVGSAIVQACVAQDPARAVKDLCSSLRAHTINARRHV